MKRRVLYLFMLVILLTIFIASGVAAREEFLPMPNGYYIYLPLIMKPGVCAGEGEIISLLDPTQVCCPGLDMITAAEPMPGGSCMVAPDIAVCTSCGDGICGPGENICNCPADC